MTDAVEPEIFHLRINDGPEQTITVNTGIYVYAAIAACAILGAVPRGSEQFHIEIWVPRLLPKYGPYHYLVGDDRFGGISVRYTIKTPEL